VSSGVITDCGRTSARNVYCFWCLICIRQGLRCYKCRNWGVKMCINVAHGDISWLVFVDTLSWSSGVTGGYPGGIILRAFDYCIAAVLWGEGDPAQTSRSRRFCSRRTALPCDAFHIVTNLCVKSCVF
jgi:hypothetical protein